MNSIGSRSFYSVSLPSPSFGRRKGQNKPSTASNSSAESFTNLKTDDAKGWAKNWSLSAPYWFNKRATEEIKQQQQNKNPTDNFGEFQYWLEKNKELFTNAQKSLQKKSEKSRKPVFISSEVQTALLQVYRQVAIRQVEAELAKTGVKFNQTIHEDLVKEEVEKVKQQNQDKTPREIHDFYFNIYAGAKK